MLEVGGVLDRATVDPYPPWYTMSHGSAMTRPPAITGPVTRPPAFTGPGDTTSDLDLDPFSMSRDPGLFVCPIFGLEFRTVAYQPFETLIRSLCF